MLESLKPVSPIDELSANVTAGFEHARAMPKSVYTSDTFAKLEVERIFAKQWLGWIMVSLHPDAPPVVDQFGDVAAMIADYYIENYVEAFPEEFVWGTNWKVLAKNFVESYHLPVCHVGAFSGLSKLDEMVYPPGDRGLCSTHARPGHLSHHERPNYDFGECLADELSA